jgi:DNA-binding CsgD family transcriptional regulator
MLFLLAEGYSDAEAARLLGLTEPQVAAAVEGACRASGATSVGGIGYG